MNLGKAWRLFTVFILFWFWVVHMSSSYCPQVAKNENIKYKNSNIKNNKSCACLCVCCGSHVWLCYVEAGCQAQTSFLRHHHLVHRNGFPLVRESQGSYCPCLHGVGIPRVCHNTWPFHTGPGDSMHSQLSALPTELSPQPAWKPLRGIQCTRWDPKGKTVISSLPLLFSNMKSFKLHCTLIWQTLWLHLCCGCRNCGIREGE